MRLPRGYLHIDNLMETNQREGTCKREFMALQDSLDLLGGKWKLLIIHYLSRRTAEENSFKKIQAGIVGISAKMLSKELKSLELNLMVSRAIQATKPVTVNYQVTEYGKQVLPITTQLIDWGLEHRETIKQNG